MNNQSRCISTVAAILMLGQATYADTCTQHQCDEKYKCSWKVDWELGSPADLHDEDPGRNGMAKIEGKVRPDGFYVKGSASSFGPHFQAADSSDWPTITTITIQHVNCCPACKESEGRCKGKALNSWKLRLEITSDGDNLAKAEGIQDIIVEELNIHCHAGAGAQVNSEGSSTWSIGSSGGLKGLGDIGFATEDSTQKGTSHVIDLLVIPREDEQGDAHCDGEAERNTYVATIEATVLQTAVEAEGSLVNQARARLDMNRAKLTLDLQLSCDNCVEEHSRKTVLFPSYRQR